MLTGTREPYPSLRVPATQEKWAATSAAPGVTRMSRIARSCRLMHQVDPNEKTVAWLILAAARTSMAETDPVALCKGPSAAAPDPWRRRAGVWAAGRGEGGAPPRPSEGACRARGGRNGVCPIPPAPHGDRAPVRRPLNAPACAAAGGAMQAPHPAQMPGISRGRRREAVPRRPPSCVGRLPPRSGRRRSRRPAAAPHGASLAECTGTMRTALGLAVAHRAAERAGEYIVTRSRQTRSLSSSAPRRPGAAVLVLAPARRSLAPGAALGCQRPSGAWPPPPHAGRRQGRPRRACVRRAGPAGRSVHCIP